MVTVKLRRSSVCRQAEVPLLHRELVIATSTVHCEGGTSEVHPAAWSNDLPVTADGTDVVPYVGTALLRMLADRVGLTSALCGGLAQTRRWPMHHCRPSSLRYSTASPPRTQMIIVRRCIERSRIHLLLAQSVRAKQARGRSR
jgi:hypothetical protein